MPPNGTPRSLVRTDHPDSVTDLQRQLRDAHHRLAERTQELHRVNKRLHEAYRQIDTELGLARRLQENLAPQALPKLPCVRFAVHHHRCGRVGGDFYDVFRLDERHVGFYLADAMGHGIAATLTSILVKHELHAKSVVDQQYRLVPTDEVLAHLNQELIDQRLSEHPFITMIYGLFNHETGALSLSRAGHPHPLHVPQGGEPRLWRQEGLLLGVVDGLYPARNYTLQCGDKVLLYTDGVDNTRFEDHAPGADSLLACAARHRAQPLPTFVEGLARDLLGVEAPPDDLTLLGLERTA